MNISLRILSQLIHHTVPGSDEIIKRYNSQSAIFSFATNGYVRIAVQYFVVVLIMNTTIIFPLSLPPPKITHYYGSFEVYY